MSETAVTHTGESTRTAEGDAMSVRTIRGMRMTPSLKFAAMVACCVAASAVLVGHATAGEIFHESYHDEGTFVHQNYCGVAGLTVRDTAVTDGTVRAVAHGPDGLAYFSEHFTQTGAFTNLANGKTVTFVTKAVTKDLKVTDNGDGTLTLIMLLTGNAVLYADGKAIGSDTGQVRVELLIDNGGTPTEPFDDEVIADLGVVKEPTGRNGDFCATVVPALT